MHVKVQPARPPDGKLRRRAFVLVNDPRFHNFIVSCVLLNAVSSVWSQLRACVRAWVGGPVPWCQEDVLISFCAAQLVLASYYFGMDSKLQFWLDIVNAVFTVIFTLEALLKIMAFDKGYFRSNWNRCEAVGSLLSCCTR
jgi:hypothetical protein